MEELQRGAERGDTKAQAELGGKYATGEGVEKHYEEALKWFRLAAEQGDAEAQNNLGLCHLDGQGVPQDYAEAVKWYRKAAAQGLASAQSNLGGCYATGRGVPQDYVEAYVWMSLARHSIPSADEAAYGLAAELTPEELAKARERVAALREKTGQGRSRRRMMRPPAPRP